MNHIMLDIETMGQPPDGAIISIGWCLFNLPPVGFTYLKGKVNVEFLSCIDAGLTLDVETLAWWLHPDQIGSLYHSLTNAYPLRSALERLKAAADWDRLDGVWASSPKFDFGLLNNAFKVCGMKEPWRHKQERCSRTILNFPMKLGDKPELPSRATMEHVADEDALYQARVLHCMVKTMRGEE